MYSGVSPQKILSQTSKIERATHLKHQKSSGRRTCPLVRSQIKSIAYNQTNPLEPEIRRNCQMLDAALLGGLFTVVWQAILGTQVNDAAKHLCLTGIKKVSRNGKIVNHDLEKALKRSFLKAQQQIASECHKELVEPSRRASKGIVIYLPQHRPDLEWLDKKIKQLKSELEKVDKETVPSGIPIEGLDEIELLLTSADELKQNQVELKQKLLEVAIENCDVAPYKTKLEQELFALVSAYFAQEIKENEKVFQIFTGQTLTRIDSRTQEMYAWLEEIVEKSHIVYQPIDWQDICQQILDEKEQQRLSSNQLTFGNHQIDDVYVPLGLVERHKVTQQRENLGAEKGSDLYREKEVTQTFEHSEFLEQVIQQGISPKSNGKRLGIIGEPGAGKTTLLRQIANWVATGISEAMVIWVSLADLQGKELETYLFDNWLLAAIKRIGKAEATAEIKDDFLAQFNAERVWLVLDGADEMAVGDGNPWAEIQRQIRTGGCIQRARIVLSCRQNVWDAIGSALDTFDTYRTLEFSYPEQVEMFIDKWFSTLANPQFGTPPNPPLVRGGTREEGDSLTPGFSTQATGEGDTLTPPFLRGAGGDLPLSFPALNTEETLTPPLPRGAGGVLSQQLREALAAPGKERIRDLVKNPLRCSLLCGTWQSLDGDLPDTKAKLYQRFVTTLYQWKKPHLNWIQQQELNAALGKLALSGMLNETSRFQLRESVGYRVMGESQFELACRLGWLNLVARDGETLEGIYAFYHPTFQEYFAALAVEDWHFFLNHIPPEGGHGDTASTGVYRIFEKQWKEVILLWLGREEVGKEKKEGFINRLVEFEDGCGDFYGYRACFLAAAGIAEFKDCSLADEIVSQIIKCGFGYFNEEKQEWQTFIDPIAEASREILKETDRERAIEALVELICTCQDEHTRTNAAYSLGRIDKNNSVAISALVDSTRNSGTESTRRLAAYSLGKIDKNNPLVFQTLVELIGTSQQKVTRHDAIYSLVELGKDNPVAIQALIELIHTSQDETTKTEVADFLARTSTKIREYNPVAIQVLIELIHTSQDETTRRYSAFLLETISKDNPVTLTPLIDLIRSYKNDYNRYEMCYRIIWIDAQNRTYPEFYQAWHTQPTNSPIPDNHRQNTDIPTLLKQLQPTDKTCPVPLNIRGLEGETDTSAIAQELCTQLYQAIFPTDTDIPAIRNAPEFKRLIPQLKNRLQKPHIALILHSCPCENALSSFTRKLADSQMGIHIAWITDTPLELPLTGFAADGEDVLEAVQDWIGGIGA
ncbi:HEAT repeat domain-containing protein [Microcoleus sp. PH2017_02_FOX_O_A]|uniref:NACHT domain-containing protein n=1 Tax=Microcoleus sp. PH2017_02_FOX_O_A TaxID=2798813 RepID=UPI0025CBC903|nr:HEAT repeat domain-containing protein [Microcoleus sp. PH2017_02_FOX_O_A]